MIHAVAVVCPELNGRSYLLVVSADDDTFDTVLLADLDCESTQQLHTGDSQTVVQAVRRADGTTHHPS